MTKSPNRRAVDTMGLLLILIALLGCDRGGKNDKQIEREDLPVGDSTYRIQKDKPVNVQILEIAIDTDDQAVIYAFLARAQSGDATAKEAMRTANPERFISLAKRGRYDEAIRFLRIMDGFGNRYAHEAIRSIGKASGEVPSTAPSRQREGAAGRKSGPLSSLSIPASKFGTDSFVKCFLAIDDWSDIPNLSPEDRIDAQNSRAKMEPQGVRGIAVYGAGKAQTPDPKSFQIAVLRFKDVQGLEEYRKKQCQYDGWASDFRRVENVEYFAVDSIRGHTRYASVRTFFIEVKQILGDGEYRAAVEPIVKQLEGKQ
jgi:hypothetical protein